MATITRRGFLGAAGSVGLGFAGLRQLLAGKIDDRRADGFGPLVTDPNGVLDLPRGFTYKPDGCGPFGPGNKRLDRIPRERLYDYGHGRTPGVGGTTTLVYDTRRQRLVRQFLSLAGTYRNCAGGPTPWNSWLTCEESVQRVGRGGEEDQYVAETNHGYVFEVPARSAVGIADPIPLTAMGRFNHEAVAIEPGSGVVYLTEDRDDGLLYRFIPKTQGRLRAGGTLQALVIRDQPGLDTRNWDKVSVPVGEKLAVNWRNLDGIDSPEDDLRLRGFKAGAARFARGEGIWYGNGEAYFACTSGGRERTGQIWRYVPSPHEGRSGEQRQPATLELFIEPNDAKLLKNADNLCVAPWGDLVLCEDRSEDVVRLVGVTPDGRLYTLAHNHLRTEFAGATFSPDGSTLFVNLQDQGLTIAINGKWGARRRS